MDTIKIVDAVVAGDKESFMNAFHAALSTKVSDALEIKKVEIASNLLNPEVETTDMADTETTELEYSDGTNETE